MKRIVLIGVLLCTPILSFAGAPPEGGDPFSNAMLEENFAHIERSLADPRKNPPNMVASVTPRSKPQVREAIQKSEPAPVTNAFLEECESLTSNRQMCYELWVERQK